MMRRLTTDWAWGGFGLTMATASAGFASYMIATAPTQVTGFGSKDFTIFAHWDTRAPSANPVHILPPAIETAAVPPPPDPPLQKIANQTIDPTPTGSIPAEPGHDLSQAPRSDVALGEFKVRNVVGDRALIEHRSRLSLVKPGSILAGAGEVLAIERQGDGWIVKTASGIIGSGT